MNNLKEMLKKECEYVPSDSTLEALLAAAISLEYKEKEPVIEVGSIDRSLYIVKSGIIRATDIDGERERTVAFATPGTVFFSKHSFIKGKPSYLRFEACCPSTVLRIPSALYREQLRTNHDFSLWILHLAYEELYYQELKNSGINQGAAKEKLVSFISIRPEIFEKVRQKYIASYLGIAPEYLCRLKKSIKNRRD